MSLRSRVNLAGTDRREFLRNTAFMAGVFATGRSFADELMATPAMTEGPFYPDHLPLDTDNDLLIVNDATTAAGGEVTHITGRVLGPSGAPLRSAFVEIWQVDNNGHYLHSGDRQAKQRDANFQGYGRFLTDTEGRYYFRTIKPVPYPGRTPHIHFAISQSGQRLLTTQLFIKGFPQNKSDGIFRDLGDQRNQDAVSVDFKPIEKSKIGELAANFDIVLGTTPPDPEDSPIHGGIGQPERLSGGRF